MSAGRAPTSSMYSVPPRACSSLLDHTVMADVGSVAGCRSSFSSIVGVCPLELAGLEGDEGPIGLAGAQVDELGQQRFPGAGLAHDQHRRGQAREGAGQFHDLLEAGIGGDQIDVAGPATRLG